MGWEKDGCGGRSWRKRFALRGLAGSSIDRSLPHDTWTLQLSTPSHPSLFTPTLFCFTAAHVSTPISVYVLVYMSTPSRLLIHDCIPASAATSTHTVIRMTYGKAVKLACLLRNPIRFVHAPLFHTDITVLVSRTMHRCRLKDMPWSRDVLQGRQQHWKSRSIYLMSFAAFARF